MNTTTHRVSETTGMALIGDAVLTLIRSAEHCLLWRGGPDWCRSTIEWFAEHPGVTRTLAVVELSAGLCLALQQQPQPGAAAGTSPREQDLASAESGAAV